MNNKQFYTVRGYQLLQQNKRLLTSSMEDYLEMICRHSAEEGYVRINKLAQLLNVSASSASKMVQKLGKLGMLEYEKYGIVTLSESGKEIGEYLLERHNIVEKFLKTIGNHQNLLIETELIEHNIGPDTLKNLEILNAFFENMPEIAEQFEAFKACYLQEEDGLD